VTGESAMRVMFMASAVQVTPKQCPDLYAKLQVACTTLGVDMPDFFIQQNPMVNAFTGGVDKSVIVLWTGLVERLNDEELLAVIAHEVGHIHAEHVLYITAARLIEAMMNASVAALVPGKEIIKFIVSTGISSALMAWARRAELVLRPRRAARHAGPARHRPDDDEARRRHLRLAHRLRSVPRAGARIDKIDRVFRRIGQVHQAQIFGIDDFAFVQHRRS
jgi:hypothetical protein